METTFEDIRIVGLDDSLTSRPKPERTELYSLHFTLSATAPSEWVKIANVGHLSTLFATCGRQVQATSRHLVVACSMPEAQKILDALKPIVARVNQEYRQWAAVRERERQKREEYERKQADARKDMAGKLKFD